METEILQILVWLIICWWSRLNKVVKMLIMQVKLKSMHAYSHIMNGIKFQNILPISKTIIWFSIKVAHIIEELMKFQQIFSFISLSFCQCKGKCQPVSILKLYSFVIYNHSLATFIRVQKKINESILKE